MSEPVLYSLAQVAQLLGVHYETAARWVRTGKLRGVKLSRRKVAVPKEELDALLTKNTASTTSPEIGTPQRWLALIRTLTPQEAERLRLSAQDFEQLEEAH